MAVRTIENMTAAAEGDRTPLHGRKLTRRELEVLGTVALGLTNAQIAGRLNISVHAVKFHLATVYRKLEVGNRTEAAVAYLTAASERHVGV